MKIFVEWEHDGKVFQTEVESVSEAGLMKEDKLDGGADDARVMILTEEGYGELSN